MSQLLLIDLIIRVSFDMLEREKYGFDCPSAGIYIPRNDTRCLRNLRAFSIDLISFLVSTAVISAKQASYHL